MVPISRIVTSWPRSNNYALRSVQPATPTLQEVNYEHEPMSYFQDSGGNVGLTNTIVELHRPPPFAPHSPRTRPTSTHRQLAPSHRVPPPPPAPPSPPANPWRRFRALILVLGQHLGLFHIFKISNKTLGKASPRNDPGTYPGRPLSPDAI